MRLRLVVLSAGNFVIGTGSLLIAGILPKVAQDLQVSITTTGQLITIYALTYAIAAPLLTAFTGKFSRRLLLITALLLFSGANGLAAFAPSYETLFIARIVAAAAGALYTPTSSAVAVTMVEPAERGRALALVFAGLPVSTVLGIPLGTFIGNNFGWRITFGLVAGLGLIATITLVLLIKGLKPGQPASLSQWLVLFKQKPLVVALSVTLLQYTAQFTAFTYIAPLLQQNTKLDGTGISLMLLVFGIAGVTGNTVGGYAADRWSLNRTLGVILSVLAVCLFTLPFMSLNVFATALNFIFWGFFGFIFNPVQQTRLIGFAPQSPNLVLSLNSSMLYFGNAGGAAIGGIVVANLAISDIGWIGGLVAVLAVGALALSATLRQPVPATTAASKV